MTEIASSCGVYRSDGGPGTPFDSMRGEEEISGSKPVDAPKTKHRLLAWNGNIDDASIPDHVPEAGMADDDPSLVDMPDLEGDDDGHEDIKPKPLWLTEPIPERLRFPYERLEMLGDILGEEEASRLKRQGTTIKVVRFSESEVDVMTTVDELNQKKPTLSILTAKPSRDISGVSNEQPWEEIEITVDSGACDTVMPREMCSGISVLQTPDSLRGMEYEVANGASLPNLGERRCLMMSEDSQITKKITFQCADVHKALLSVSRVADLGYACTLGKFGGQLEDTVTGEKIPLHRRGNLYVMRAWIRQDPSGFARPP